MEAEMIDDRYIERWDQYQLRGGGGGLTTELYEIQKDSLEWKIFFKYKKVYYYNYILKSIICQ